MNGLKYIRNRCNLSLNDLACALGVTRQALSLWETEKKPIPPQRKKQLADFFGIDEDYFGCITENEKKELLEKAMFRYVENGKETYRYKPKNDSLTGEVVCFPGDVNATLDEQYIAMQKRRQTTLEKADALLRENQIYYDTIYDGSDYIFSLAKQFRAHWQAQSDTLDNSLPITDRSQTSSVKSIPPLQETSLSMEAQIQQMESENRTFWKEHPEMKDQNGLSFHT